MRRPMTLAGTKIESGTSPAVKRLTQKTFVSRCHAPHQTPTINPVANTP